LRHTFCDKGQEPLQGRAGPIITHCKQTPNVLDDDLVLRWNFYHIFIPLTGHT